MGYRAIYQELENYLLRDRHPSAPNYTLVLLLAEIYIWLAVLCLILAVVSLLAGPVIAMYLNKPVTLNITIGPYTTKYVTKLAPVYFGVIYAILLFICSVVNFCISQLIHAYRDIARNGFKQNALLEKLTGEPTEKQLESAAALPDLAPVPRPNAAQDPRNPPPHWVPGTPRGWTISGLDVNGMQFHLSYLWVTQEQAEAYAKAEGIVTIQEVQPIRD